MILHWYNSAMVAAIKFELQATKICVLSIINEIAIAYPLLLFLDFHLSKNLYIHKNLDPLYLPNCVFIFHSPSRRFPNDQQNEIFFCEIWLY